MPKGFSATVPEMDEVTPEKEKLIAQFLERQNAFYGDKKPHFLTRAAGDERVLAYKFLTARKWNVDDAEKMFRSVIQMREERKLDKQPLFPSPFPTRGFEPVNVNKVMELPPREENIYDRYYRTVNPAYACNFHKWDKQGHPILIERTGQCNVRETFARFKALANVGQKPTQPAVDFQLFLNEVGGTLVRYQDTIIREQEGGRRILGIVMIMDMKGLGYGHLWRPCLEILKATFTVDATYYPEGLHRLYLVNCPTMIMFAFNIVKGWIDPRVHEKITFLPPNETTETLLKVIDAERLPSFLGGSCECEGGCVPQASLESSPTTSSAAGEGDTFTEEIVVPAGKTFVKEFELVAGEEVAWEFASTKDKGIMFSVSWFDTESSGERVVVEAEHLKDGSNTHIASSKGKLVLTWDNSAAWFTSKTLQMRVFKMAPQPVE